jgi:hypothetical protein
MAQLRATCSNIKTLYFTHGMFLFIYGTFNDALGTLDYTASNGRTINE